MSTRKANANVMGNDLQTALERLRESEAYDKEAVRDEISEQIHLVMTREGVKPAELARRLGKSRAYITKILQGNANFTIDSLVQIARALGYRYAPVFLPREAEWKPAGAIHLSAKAARTTPGLVVEDDKDYIHVEIAAEGADNEESTKRTAS